MGSVRSKADVINTVRSRFVRKYGPEYSPTIDKHLSKLIIKNKVSVTDLHALENTIKKEVGRERNSVKS